MNRIYNLVWSAARGAIVVVSEFAKSHGKKSGERKLRKCRLRVRVRLFITGVLLLVPLSAFALPIGGKVSAGQATVQTGVKDMVVNQSSDRAVIDWDSFNVGAGESVTFHQNSANSAVLNRVYDQSASTVAGKLSANGQIFIANPNGVVFGKGAEVNVGGLVATTRGVDPGEFMTGAKVTLSGDSGAPVLNEGSIKAGEGGYVALVAARVSNTGTIEARKGKVALTAADTVDLTFDNGSLVDLQVSKGALDAEVDSGGVIRAPGGKVMLTAKAANKLTSAAVNNTGVIEARTLGDLTGHIELIADMDVGTVKVGGALDASALDGGNGGFIETSGAHVKVLANAKITTKAPAGKSGTWLIDPVDFKIAPDFGDITGKQLSDQLKDGNVAISSTQGSTAGSGDILVYDNVAWDHNTLTLDAVNSIVVKAAMALGGDAGLGLKYKNELIVAPGSGRVDFTGTSNTLTFNGKGVTIIRDINQLQNMQQDHNAWYALGADIDASMTKGWNGGKGFVGIWGFAGFFDGLGHTVDGLYMNDPSHTGYGVGLFDSTLSGAKIRNIGVTNASVTGYGSYGGILVGENMADISYAFTTGFVNGLQGTCWGGLAGHDTGGQIFNSFSSATVKGASWIGGLVGHVTGNASFYQSYATGEVIGNGYSIPAYGLINVGGLVGGLDTTATVAVRDSYSTVKISAPGYSYVGGLIGNNISGRQIINGYWDVDVTGMKTSAGGTGLTSAQMRNPASFSGWDIDIGGGQATTWRMYQGKDAPMLKAFLRPVEAYMTDETFTYNGKSQAVDLLQWSGVDVDTSRLHYTTNAGQVTAQNVGAYDIYSYNFFSDPFGYDIIFHGPTQGKITITPAALAVKANDGRKTYDGKAYTKPNGVTYIGLVGGETSAVLGGALAFDNGYQGATNAGSYTINASGLTSNNYSITYLPGTLTIDKAALTVTAGDVSKTYDGQQFVGGNGITLNGLVNGETADVLGGQLTWAGNAQGAINAGAYSILADGYTSANYKISYAPGTLTVGRADLTLGTANVTKTYDGTLGASGRAVVVAGQLFGDDTISGGDFAFTDKDAGSGKTVAVANVTVNDGNDGGNYSVSYQANTASTIEKASLKVTANDATKTYDNKAYAGGNGVTYSGFVNGETTDVLGGTLAFGGDSQGALNAGSYTISAGGLTSKNYAFDYVSGALAINKARLIATANDDARAYNGQMYTGGNGVSYAGFAQGDSAANLGGKIVWSGDSQGAVNAGDYAISASGLTSGNYDISYLDGSLHVAKAALVLGSTAVTKIYDGNHSAQGKAIVLGGQLYRDDSLEGGDFAFTDKNAGSGKTVSVGNVMVNDGNGGGNYDVSYQANTSSTIQKAGITILAKDATKDHDGQAFYGGNGVVYTGFIAGEGAGDLGGSLQWSGSSQGAANVGEYLLLPGGLTSDNYTIAYEPATLTIKQALPYSSNGNNSSQKPVTLGSEADGGSTVSGAPEGGGTNINEGSKAGNIGDVVGSNDSDASTGSSGSQESNGAEQGFTDGDSSPNGGGGGSATDQGDSLSCSGASTRDGDSKADGDCLIPAKARASKRDS